MTQVTIKDALTQAATQLEYDGHYELSKQIAEFTASLEDCELPDPDWASNSLNPSGCKYYKESTMRQAVAIALAKQAGEIELLTTERDVNKRMRDQHFAQVEKLKADAETYRDLLQEVSANFTREDDLPDELIPRIDAALKKGEQ